MPDLQECPLWVAFVSLINGGESCVISMPPDGCVPVMGVGSAGALAIDTAVVLCQETPEPMVGVYGVYLSYPVSVEHLRAFAVPHFGNIMKHPAVVGMIIPNTPIGWDYRSWDGCGNPSDYAEA